MRRTLATILLLAATAAARDDADDADAAIFLGPLKAGAGDTVVERVILTNVAGDAAWKGVFDVLKERKYTKTLAFKGRKVATAFKELKRLRPRFVVVVVPHDTIDVNWHFDFLERASRIDDDPFVDFAFGYITGATPAEAVAFAQGIAKARRLPQTILEFGPSTKPFGPSVPFPHKNAKEWKMRTYWHEKNAADVTKKLDSLDAIGIYRAGGHGWPHGVDEGLSGRQLRESGLSLFPALYFSGPCYCGVPSRWFKVVRGRRVEEQKLDVEESFLLSLIRAGATGIFAGLDPDRGETNEHELEHVLATGEPLGMASKSTYDDVAVAYRRKKLALPRYKDGGGWPFKDIHDQMISGAACRGFFGDPTFQPIEKAFDDPFACEGEWTKRGYEVTWRGDANVSKYWTPVDVLRAEGYWTHRIRLRLELPLDEARKLKGFEVLAVTKDGKEVGYAWPTAAVEEWAGMGRLHIAVTFPHDPQNRVLWDGRKYEARFLLKGSR